MENSVTFLCQHFNRKLVLVTKNAFITILYKLQIPFYESKQFENTINNAFEIE